MTTCSVPGAYAKMRASSPDRHHRPAFRLFGNVQGDVVTVPAELQIAQTAAETPVADAQPLDVGWQLRRAEHQRAPGGVDIQPKQCGEQHIDAADRPCLR